MSQFYNLSKYQEIPISCLLAVIGNIELHKIIRLLPKYNVHTLSDLCNLETENLAKIPGVGKSKISKIKDLIGLLDEDLLDSAVAYYENCVVVRELPSKVKGDESIINYLRCFVKEYVEYFRERKEKRLVPSTFSRQEMVELAYMHNYTREQIAENQDV